MRPSACTFCPKIDEAMRRRIADEALLVAERAACEEAANQPRRRRGTRGRSRSRTVPAVSFTAAVAASSRVAVECTPRGVAPSYPSRQATTGFRLDGRPSTASATPGDDGLETMSRTRVWVAAQGRDPEAWSPPTAAWRSRPGADRGETWLLSRWIKVVSSECCPRGADHAHGAAANPVGEAQTDFC
jgi:hypothetical protein